MSQPLPTTEDRTIAALRRWLEYVAEQAIAWLDVLDAADEDREPEDAA